MSPDRDEAKLPEPGSLSATQAEEMDRACDRFEAAWRCGGRPDLPAYLAGTDGAERATLARELVAVDVHWRRRAGELPGADEYITLLPNDAESVRDAFEEVGQAQTDQSVILAAQRPGSDPAGFNDTNVMLPSATPVPGQPAALTLPSSDGPDPARA